MYKRHSIWDEDKLDIRKDTKYAGGSGSGYAGHDKDDSSEYHKQEPGYNSGKPGEKGKDLYNSGTAEDEDKKKEEEKDALAETIEEEEKKNKKDDEEEDFFKNMKKEINPAMFEEENRKKEGKQHKTIEEAIDKAVKEEKKTIFID